MLEAFASSEDAPCGTLLAEFVGLSWDPFGGKFDENREKVIGRPLELVGVDRFKKFITPCVRR